MTPRETMLCLEAAAWQAEQEQSRMVSLAWHTAALSRAKRMPRLRELLQRMRPSRVSRLPLEARRQEFDDLKSNIEGKLPLINRRRPGTGRRDG